ncbi:MAG: hypothetical protein ACTHK8_00040 [Ginsengibacter sp.]|jgi:hypothetical protein
MALSPKTKTFTFLLFSLLVIESCTLTTTKQKMPVFSESGDSLRTELNQLVVCEDLNVDGKQVTTDGKTSSVLEIDVVNGRGIPANEDQMAALGKRIAVKIKEALQDKNEYNTYKVLFVAVRENGSVTQRKWRGKIFQSDDL